MRVAAKLPNKSRIHLENPSIHYKEQKEHSWQRKILNQLAEEKTFHWHLNVKPAGSLIGWTKFSAPFVAKVADLWSQGATWLLANTSLAVVPSSLSNRELFSGSDTLACDHHRLAAVPPKWALLPLPPAHRLVELTRKPFGWRFGLFFPQSSPRVQETKEKNTSRVFSCLARVTLPHWEVFFFFLEKQQIQI